MGKMKTLAMVSLATLSLFSCSDEEFETDAFTLQAKEMAGGYQLEEIHWSGTSVDLNNDGTGRWSLVEEMTGLLGYANSLTTATATLGDKGLNIEVNLPYPDYKYKDGKFSLYKVCYMPVSFTFSDTEGLSHPYYQGLIRKDSTFDPEEVFLSGVSEVSVCEMKDDELGVRVHCVMYNLDTSEANENYLHYRYKKTTKQ